MPIAGEWRDELAVTLLRVQVIELPGGHAPHLVAADRFLDRKASFQASF